MRLLHVTQLRFENFVDEECPPYGIPSHIRGTEEITLQQFPVARTVSLFYSAKRSLASKLISDNLPQKERVLEIAGLHCRRKQMGLNTSGVMLVAATRPTEPSFPKASIRCMNGTEIDCTVSIWWIYHLRLN